MPVRVTGREGRGRVSFTYNSKEELEEFISRLQSAGAAFAEPGRP
jgi:hypothetical protein